MSNDIDFRTPAQRAREDRQNSICAEFLEAYKQHPDHSPHRIICALAEAHGLTPPGIKVILIERGIYQTNGRKPLIILGGMAV